MKWSSLLAALIIVIIIGGGWIIIIIFKTPIGPDWPGPWCLSCPPMLKTLGGAIVLAGLASLYALGRVKEEFRQGKF
jgi:hypothetical protein